MLFTRNASSHMNVCPGGSLFCSGYKPPGCVFKSPGNWSKAFLKAGVRASREELRGYSRGEVLPMGPMCHCHCYFSSEPVLPLLCSMILKSWNHQMWFSHYWQHGKIEPVCRSYQRDCKVINPECWIPSYL